jgi:hypothetical protein
VFSLCVCTYGVPSPPTVGRATHPWLMFPGPAVARPASVWSSVMAGLPARFARWRRSVTPALRTVSCRPNVPGCRGADTSALEQVPFHPRYFPVAREIDLFQSMGYAHKAAELEGCRDTGVGEGDENRRQMSAGCRCGWREPPGVVHQHAAFPQDFPHVAIAQGIAQIQPHRTEHDVSLEIALFEWGGFTHGRSSIIWGQHRLALCISSPAIPDTDQYFPGAKTVVWRRP